jgi:hypothetical protein
MLGKERLLEREIPPLSEQPMDSEWLLSVPEEKTIGT